RCLKAMLSKKYSLIILDEINVALDFGLLKLQDILELIQSRPPNMELILTGRYAPPEIIEVADLVSEIVEVKHPYQKGIAARKGVEM
ncbi:MAG: cob(I)yrinic acid a,c-diamide adenosyltransferase, partial [Candidatus Thorarchaeota archaeon]